MNWIQILIQLLPMILQLLQLLFPPKATIALGPFQKRLVARACGRMQAFIDKAKEAGIADGDIAAAKSADDELSAVLDS